MFIQNPATSYRWLRIFTVLLLIAFLLPTSSVFAQTHTTSPFEKHKSTAGVGTQSLTVAADPLPLTSGNFLSDPSFEESYGSTYYWGQSSTNFDTPLCTLYDCGDGAGTAGPRTGNVWAWFGGTTAYEQAELYQFVPFPSCTSATLQFYFWIGKAGESDAGFNGFAAYVDGTTIFSADDSQISSYPTYTLVSIDVSSFADGYTHKVGFVTVTSGQIITFNLDDVALFTTGCTISGNVGAAGIPLNYTDGTTKTVTSQADGSYSLTIATPMWTGTVEPSNVCYTFNPPNRSYYNLSSNQIGQNYTATFNPGAGCATMDVEIGGVTKATYALHPGVSQRQSYASTNSGPVEVSGSNAMPILASQRVIFGGKSYSEMMGLPNEQLTNEYLFPYYNNVAMDSQLRVSNLGNVPTTIKVYLGTQQIDSFSLGGGGAVRKNYAGKNAGPLKVTSSATNILSTIRVLFNGISYSEMMGLPKGQLTKEYLFPYYNNVAMDSQLRVSNVGGVATTITVYLGTQQIDSYTLGVGGATRKNYAGRNSGPLRVTSSASDILTTIRVVYGSGYSEMMGFPVSNLATEYWYPVYDNSALDSQLRVSNVGGGLTTITVYAGTTQIDSYSLGAGAATRKNYVNKNTGPLHVVSNPEPILSTIRMLYTTPGYASYYEMMGLPGTQLSTQYFFPWYNNFAMDSQMRFAVP